MGIYCYLQYSLAQGHCLWYVFMAAWAYVISPFLPVFQAGLNGHMYKMPEIPESFPELSDMR